MNRSMKFGDGMTCGAVSPSLECYATLSPVPGFRTWLNEEDERYVNDNEIVHSSAIKQLMHRHPQRAPSK